jgi:hypothetical protein
MLRRVRHVLHQQRLAPVGHLPRHALADPDPRAEHVGRQPARRGEVQRARLGRAQHERAPLRLHVVADERDQAVGKLARSSSVEASSASTRSTR